MMLQITGYVARFGRNRTVPSIDTGIATVSACYRITPMIDLMVGYDDALGTAAQDHAGKATLCVKF